MIWIKVHHYRNLSGTPLAISYGTPELGLTEIMCSLLSLGMACPIFTGLPLFNLLYCTKVIGINNQFHKNFQLYCLKYYDLYVMEYSVRLWMYKNVKLILSKEGWRMGMYPYSNPFLDKFRTFKITSKIISFTSSQYQLDVFWSSVCLQIISFWKKRTVVCIICISIVKIE